MRKKKWFSHLQNIRSTYCNAKSAFSRVAPNFISLENEALKKIRKTSIFCTQRKYLEFPVRKCSIYQLEDTAENGGCGRFCYHTHFVTKILFKYIGLTRVSVQWVKSLGSHFACLCRGFEFYLVKKNLLLFFKKKMEILLHF